MSNIDFVLTWVDGGDLKWQEQYKKYKSNKDISFAQYRDYDTLKYWFRAVEKYAPWVRKIHFVTCGQTPEWLNTEHEKLNLVNHVDYIPSEYLPTFSSHVIELNFHRIKDLSEQFVYFNDDTFLSAPVSEKDFFKKGKPRDCAVLSALTPRDRNEIITHIFFNNLTVINSNFNKKNVLKGKLKKWLSLRYGKCLFKNLYYLPLGAFSGFVDPHMPNAYLKSTFNEVWEKEGELLDKVSKNKFRTKDDVNQWLMRYWQLVKGEFYPRSCKIGAMLSLSSDIEKVDKILQKKSHKLICVNDDPNAKYIENLTQQLCKTFEKTFSEKCSFEK